MTLDELCSHLLPPDEHLHFETLLFEDNHLTLRATLTAPDILRLPPYLGGIDQWVDNTDVLSNPAQFRQLRSLYQPNDAR